MDSKTYWPALTGLRGIAALWLALCHFRNEVYAYWGTGLFSLDWLRFGFYGVDIFFILSGFVIAHIHLEDFRRFTIRRTWRFALLRFFRIYPLHWFVMACLAALLVTSPDYLTFTRTQEPERLHAANIAANLLLFDNWTIMFFGHPWNGVSWTLSLEILAYCAFPALAWAMCRLNENRLCLLLAALALTGLGCFMAVTGNLDANLKWRGGLLRLFCQFIAGMLLARAWRLQPSGWTVWLGILSLGWILLCLMIPVFRSLVYSGLGALVLALTNPRDHVARWCSARPAAWLGEISYSFYLIHALLLQGLFWLIAPSVESLSPAEQRLAVIIAVLPIFLLAALVNRCIERPARHIGRLLAARWRESDDKTQPEREHFASRPVLG